MSFLDATILCLLRYYCLEKVHTFRNSGELGNGTINDLDSLNQLSKSFNCKLDNIVQT